MAKFSSSLFRFVALIGRLSIWALGVVAMVVACLLITDVVFVYAHLVLPVIVERGVKFNLLLMGLCVISFSVFFNYFAACGVHPGGVPEWYRRKEEIVSHGWATFCRLCGTDKPPRSHHCVLCSECVLKMDHHCPWINQCVGYHNQRYFFLFLLSLLIGTAFCGIGFGCVYFDQCCDAELYADCRLLRESTIVVFSLAVVIALFFAMVLFVGWNSYMLLTNQTSIEYHHNKDEAVKVERLGYGATYRNPFDLGRWRNLEEVFGMARPSPPLCPSVGSRHPWSSVPMLLWMLLPSVQPLPGNGLDYPTWESEIA